MDKEFGARKLIVEILPGSSSQEMERGRQRSKRKQGVGNHSEQLMFSEAGDEL